MILSRNMLKRMGEECTGGLVIEVFDDSVRLALMLYFFMVAYNAACQTLSTAFLKSNEDIVEVLLVLVIFLRENS